MHACKLTHAPLRQPTSANTRGRYGAAPAPEQSVASLATRESAREDQYVQGHPLDYERWADEGTAGWGWEGVLPYFRKAD
jgi:choline dehydrogenase-like flavoprotein